jgi:CheY-like chemotaxis protein
VDAAIPTEDDASAPAVNGAGPLAANGGDGPGPRVLVVDDDPASRDLLGRFLLKEGFRVITASSGAEGLRLARSLHPDAITLDVMMPGMDGWTVVRHLSADPALRTIPIVVITAKDVDQETRAHLHGCVATIVQKGDLNHQALLHDLRALLQSSPHHAPHGAVPAPDT